VNLSQTDILLIVVIVIVALVALLFWSRSRRSADLKSRFGPEYGRTVDQLGDEAKAEKVLAERQKRVSSYTIKPLPPEMRDHFVNTWRNVQAQFVDDPKYAVTRADDLLGEVMGARGYPVRDFDQRAEDLSVDHPEVVQNYRSAHDIALRHSRGEASTEDLRTAMIHYRALFDDLVNEPEPGATARVASKEPGHG
jgi:FtsZ-interacting cell division protein ZipA